MRIESNMTQFWSDVKFGVSLYFLNLYLFRPPPAPLLIWQKEGSPLERPFSLAVYLTLTVPMGNLLLPNASTPDKKCQCEFGVVSCFRLANRKTIDLDRTPFVRSKTHPGQAKEQIERPTDHSLMSALSRSRKSIQRPYRNRNLTHSTVLT